MVQIRIFIKIFFLIIVPCNAWDIRDFFSFNLFKNEPKDIPIWNVDKDIRIKFYLYTQELERREILENESASEWKLFNPNKKTTIITHGYSSNSKALWVDMMAKALLKKEDANIILVDWTMPYRYDSAVMKMESLAFGIHMLLNKLSITHNIGINKWRYIKLIGHSLGAHASGLIAKRLYLNDHVLVDRIVALDPARPDFDEKFKYLRVNKNFTKLLDVIHSNGNPDQYSLGLYEPIGHLDFYPNGGDFQPRCDESVGRSFSPIAYVFGVNPFGLIVRGVTRWWYGDYIMCNHSEATYYFINSMVMTFIGFKMDLEEIKNINDTNRPHIYDCNVKYKCIPMGYDADKYNHEIYQGTYYVNVNFLKEPFSSSYQ